MFRHLSDDPSYYREPFHMRIMYHNSYHDRCRWKSTILPPLHRASFEGDSAQLEEILKTRNVNVNEMFGNESPLHLAASNSCYFKVSDADYAKCVRLLLIHQAEINLKDYNGNTPLHRACQSRQIFGSESTVKILLEYNVSLNIQNNDGNTPLHCCRNFQIIRDLLIYGADTTVKNKIGKTASEASNLYCQEYLLECMEEIEKMKSVELNDIKTLYDVLFMTPSIMERYVENDVLQEIRNDGNWRSEVVGDFVEYRFMLEEKFLQGLERKNAKESFQLLTGFRIPDLCYEELFKFLNRKDLNNVAESKDLVNITKLLSNIKLHDNDLMVNFGKTICK